MGKPKPKAVVNFISQRPYAKTLILPLVVLLAITGLYIKFRSDAAAGYTPGNTYTHVYWPAGSYTNLNWSFTPKVDAPASLTTSGYLHYYFGQFFLTGASVSVGGGYAGLVSNGHIGNQVVGKAINFSIWGSNGSHPGAGTIVNPNNSECGCHQLMLPYNYAVGHGYRFTFARGPSGTDSTGTWWGLWVTDTNLGGVQSYVGEQHVPYVNGQPLTQIDGYLSINGEDTHWQSALSGSKVFQCSDFEPSEMRFGSYTMNGKIYASSVDSSTNAGQVYATSTGTTVTACPVAASNGGYQFFNTDHKLGYWGSNPTYGQPAPAPAPTPTPPPQTPYSGSPIIVPGTIEAEYFDKGGEGVSYHDAQTGNQCVGSGFTCLRTTEDVDIRDTMDTGGGNQVGWTAAGEWLEYTINVVIGGNLPIGIRSSQVSAGSVVHLELDGTPITNGSYTLPSTGSYNTFATVTKTLYITAGTHILRLKLDANNTGGSAGDFNYLIVGQPGSTTAPSPAPAPSPSPVPIPQGTGGFIGNTTIGTSTARPGANYKFGSWFSTAGISNLAKFNIYARGGASSQSFVPILYKADGSGNPTTLVAKGSAFTVSAGKTAGWMSVTFPNTTLTAGNYVLGVLSGSTSQGAYLYYTPASTSNYGSFNQNTYPTPTSTWGSVSHEPRKWSFYLN